jgi:hypothetical protein
MESLGTAFDLPVTKVNPETLTKFRAKFLAIYDKEKKDIWSRCFQAKTPAINYAGVKDSKKVSLHDSIENFTLFKIVPLRLHTQTDDLLYMWSALLCRWTV